jgi:hypothetical protein
MEGFMEKIFHDAFFLKKTGPNNINRLEILNLQKQSFLAHFSYGVNFFPTDSKTVKLVTH